MKTTTKKQFFEDVENHVKHYKTDIQHDRETLKIYEGRQFIHIAREHGTSMSVFLTPGQFPAAGERVKYLFGTANRQELLKSFIDTVKYYLQINNHICHYSDGRQIYRATDSEILEKLEQYDFTIRAHWNEEKYLKTA